MSILRNITSLGEIRIFDEATGKLILEGELNGFTFRDETGSWKVERTKPKICPHCGKELKEEGDHGN